MSQSHEICILSCLFTLLSYITAEAPIKFQSNVILLTSNLMASTLRKIWWDNKTSCCSVHYCDVIMGAVAFQITSLTTVYSTVYSDADQRKHQSSASLAFVWGIHRGPVNSPHKWPVTWEILMTSSWNRETQIYVVYWVVCNLVK